MRKLQLLVDVLVFVFLVALGLRVPAAADDGQMAKARENYQSNCVKCHGEGGKGDGPGAAMLKPKPRDYTDCKAMQAKKDEELFKAIKGIQ